MNGNAPSALRKNLPALIAGLICLIAVICILLLPGSRQAAQVSLSEYASVSTICELATLKSFYHNVAMYEKEPGGGSKFVNNVLFWPFGSYTKVGYKQFWLEYSGIVEAGIDASQISISGPDAQGVVEVYVPDARVLSVYADEDSLTEPLTERGLFTKISGKEKAQAFSTAQSAMRQEAENDQALLRRAKENAKLLLERYIVNTGAGMGLRLSVRWVDSP